LVLASLIGWSPLCLEAGQAPVKAAASPAKTPAASPAKTSAAPQGKAVADPEALLAKARAAYIGLSARGFRGYRFVARPDWSVSLAELAKSDPAGYEAALKLLTQIRFDVRVGAHGQSQVTHTVVDAPNEGATQGLNQIYQGVEQALNGFFQTWGPFVVQRPVPAAGVPCKVVDLGAQYQFSWEETGEVRVELRTDRAFAISVMKIASPAFDAVIQPTFDRTAQGLVLTGYEGDFKPKGDGAAMNLKIRITNQVLEGLPVPGGLDATVQIQGRTDRMVLGFSELKVEPKQAEPK
jgi:hypothetical protein